MEKQIKLALESQYGIVVKESKQLRGYYDSNFRIYDGEKHYFVKLFGFDNEASVIFQVDFITVCYRAGIPVAKALKTKTGKQQIIVEGKPLIVQEFLIGEPLIDAPHTDVLLESIGETLGKIHKVSSQATFQGSKWKKYEWDLAQFYLVVENLEKAKPYLDKECLDLVSAVIDDWKKELNQFEGLRKGVIHNDFHGLNLLVADNRCSGVTDFGDALESWFPADIAVALMHICLCKDKPFVLAHRFLQGYQKHFDLTENERALLPLLSKMRAVMIIINQKMDFKDSIPEDYQKIFNHAVRVLKLLTEKSSKDKLKELIDVSKN